MHIFLKYSIRIEYLFDCNFLFFFKIFILNLFIHVNKNDGFIFFNIVLLKFALTIIITF